MASLPDTLGALRRSAFGAPRRAARSVKDEVRANLLKRLAGGGPVFEGVIGYEDTVVPQIVNALLSRHNFILLGLRGQAKSRILRALITLLDPEMPIVAGSEVNDNPFAPISKYARQLIDDAGDDAPIAWVSQVSFEGVGSGESGVGREPTPDSPLPTPDQSANSTSTRLS